MATNEDTPVDGPEDDAAAALAALTRAFADIATTAYTVSPHRAVLALRLSTEAPAVQFVNRHPTARADVIARLRQIAANVRRATVDVSAVRH